MEHPWEGLILNRFLSADKNRQEKEYYPPYNLLLYTHFPPTEDFIVAPVTYPLGNRESIDFTIGYVIERNNMPVFVLEVKPPISDADRQLRRRLNDMVGDCPIDVLHGISAFGTSVAFYNVNKLIGSINPPAIEGSETIVTDTAPIDRWSNNLLNAECANRIDDLFNEIKMLCRSISRSIEQTGPLQ